jgi:hypothetical protein
MKVDYIAIMQGYCGSNNNGFLTDEPISIPADDDYVRMRSDRKAMRLMPSRPSRIKSPTAKELIQEYRKKSAQQWGV